jgi:hypothetical protein
MFVTPSSWRPLCYLLKSQAACFSSSSSNHLNYILHCYNFSNTFFKVFHYTCLNSLGNGYDVLFLIMFIALCSFAGVMNKLWHSTSLWCVELCCSHKECFCYIQWLRLVLYSVMLCILSDHHQGIYIYTAFTFYINKVCIDLYSFTVHLVLIPTLLIIVLKFQDLPCLLVVMFLLFGIDLPSQLLCRCVLFKYLWNIVLNGF